ncbi:hypothetical protein M9H77_30164 [Catharanthus roseus]|uniref:Uncharacterized protein n=1 Tax=Catharanthus roseus TaxID=4058 RepID=A0ACB9ZWH6_CATRO|nr:hypothetical protein M9H77_30164 [Catharanthus roseus]
MSNSRPSNYADEAVSENSQSRQPEPTGENTPHLERATYKVKENFMIRMRELSETSMAIKRNERVPAIGTDEALERFLKFRPLEFYGEAELIDTDENKTRQFVKRLREELQWALALLPAMVFAVAVEAATKTEMEDQARPRGEQRIKNRGWRALTPGGVHRCGKLGHTKDQCPWIQQVPPETSKRPGRPPVIKGATEGRSDKP